MAGNVHFFTGDDEARIGVEANGLFYHLAGENPDPFSSDVIVGQDGETPAAALSRLIASIMTPPFMGGEKVIWLKHFSAFEGEGTVKSDAPLDKMLRALGEKLREGLPDGVTLIMDGTGVDKKKSFWKTCESCVTVHEFKRPDMKDRNWRDNMRQCLKAAAERRGMQLSYEVAEAMIDLLGCNTDLIDSELDKLVCYCGEGVLPQVQDVLNVCTPSGEELGWAVNECIGKRDLAGALAAAENLIARDKDPGGRARALIMNAVNTFGDYLRVIVFMAENRLKRPDELKNFLERLDAETKKQYKAEGNIIAAMHPFRAKMVAEQAGRYKPHQMIQAIVALRDAMWQTTSSSISPVVALENALLKIVGQK